MEPCVYVADRALMRTSVPKGEEMNGWTEIKQIFLKV
jgi:hypothetical protein